MNWSARIRPRPVAAALAALVFLAATEPLRAGRDVAPQPGEEVAPSELVVHLQPGAALGPVLSVLKGSARELAKARALRLGHFAVTDLPAGTEREVSALFAAQPGVQLVEPNKVRRLSIANPDDPSFATQWNLAAAAAAAAWKNLPGRYLTSATATTSRVRVAVLDTGADCTHPDFANAGGSSTNSAAGGQLNWALSRAFAATTLASPACTYLDDHGHGTHVAGIVAAATNNGTGIGSLGFPLELVIFKVLTSAGTTTDTILADAIVAAVDAGAQVISMSLGGGGYSQLLQDAVNYAWARNVVMVAAAGNRGTISPTYPAANNHAIGVAAFDSANQRATFSNRGDAVDVAAPGVSILSTVPSFGSRYGSGYATLSGTSMATPHVAALAGLLMMASPGVSADAVTQRIQRSADSSTPGGGWELDMGYGRMNAERALTGEGWRTATTGSVTGQVMDAAGLDILGATVTLNGTAVVTADGGQFRFAGLAPGDYTMTVAAAGRTTLSLPVTVVAGADTPTHVWMGVTYGTFTGSVLAGGVPVEGAIVHALNAGSAAGVAVTNSLGRFRLAVPAATYSFRAGAFFHTPASAAARAITGGATIDLGAISISPLGRLEGHVRDASSAGVSGATVLLQSAGPNLGAMTDATGYYRTIPAPAGTYSGQASAAGLPSSSVATLSITNGATALADFLLSSGALTVTPAGVTLGPSGTRQFTALLNGAPYSSVNWTISPAGVGTVSAGLYTAPSTISSPQSVTVRATHPTDASLTAAATVSLSNTLTLSLAAASAVGGNTVAGNTVTLNLPAPAGGATVSLSSTNAAAGVPPTVLVPPGATSQTFSITTTAVGAATPTTIQASWAGAVATTGFTVQPPALGIAVSLGGTTFGAGNSFTTGLVTLSGGTAPAGGLAVTLGSSNAALLSVPGSVTVPAGAAQAAFSFSTGHPGSATGVTVTAAAGAASGSATATVTPLQVASVTLFGGSTTGGQTQTANSVRLTGSAPAGGAAVGLSSSNTGAAQVPATVTVPGSATSAAFTITTSAVGAATPVTITASLNGSSQGAGFTVNPPGLSSLSLAAASVAGGATLAGNQVIFSSAAPAGGATVTLLSSQPGVASVPASVTVPAGATTVSFSIGTSAVATNTPVTITATFNGVNAPAGLTVLAPALSSVTLGAATFAAGASSSGGVVTISSAAPAAGLVVGLSSSNPSVLGVPPSVTIPGGATQAGFSLAAGFPSSSTPVTITASLNGATANAGATVTPLQLTALTLAAPSAAGGATVGGNTVSINAPAPAGGATVALASSQPGAATVPATVIVPAGATSASFSIATSTVAANTPATITASFNGAAIPAGFTVRAPVLSSVSLGASAFAPGTASSGGLVSISSAAPAAGLAIALSSTNPAALGVPPSVTIPGGATQAAFSFSAGYPSAATPVTVTASLNGVNATANATVNPLQLTALTLAAPSASGGTSVSGNAVFINAPAPASGAVITLGSSNTSAAQVPASVTIPAGATSAAFTITTSAVASTTALTIAAGFSGTTLSSGFTVTAAAPSYQVTAILLNQPSGPGGIARKANLVRINTVAPAAGVVVALSSSNPAILSVPATVTVSSGYSDARLQFTPATVTVNTPVTITATAGGATVSAVFTVTPPSLGVLQLLSNPVTGGTGLTGRVTLSGPAPAGGFVVGLSSSGPAASVPLSMVVPAGASLADFSITTTPVPASTTVTISASQAGAVRTASLTVNP